MSKPLIVALLRLKLRLQPVCCFLLAALGCLIACSRELLLKAFLQPLNLAIKQCFLLVCTLLLRCASHADLRLQLLYLDVFCCKLAA